MGQDLRQALGDQETKEVRMTAKNPRMNDAHHDYEDAEAQWS